MALEQNQNIDQVLDIRILKQFLAKDDSRLNIINIGTIVTDKPNGSHLSAYTLDELMKEVLMRLPYPRHKHLENLAVRTAYEIFSDRGAQHFLGMASGTFHRRLERSKKDMIDAR